MILRILKAEVRGPHHLELSFNDGARAVMNVEPLLNGLIFEPLRDPSFFARGVLDPVCGTVIWPNGADFAPEALYALLPVAAVNAEQSAAADRKVTKGGQRTLGIDEGENGHAD